MDLSFSDVIAAIPNYPVGNQEELINGLAELENMVGLDKIKKLILGQIAYGLMLLTKKESNKYMLHTLITGPPGVGKTKLAKILGKIWSAIGLLNRDETSEKEESGKEESEKEESESERERALVTNMEIISSTVETIKEIIPVDVLHMTEEENVNDLPILWRLDNINFLAREHEKRQPSRKRKRETIFTAKFMKVTRADLVGKYQGHTAAKTLKILHQALGGVLFVDEAYQLITSHDGNGDNFGAECLTTINEFMSENPSKIMIIFGGYDDAMNETIFRVQPGLKRRFPWQFNIPSYNCQELGKIVLSQFYADKWTMDFDITDDWLSSFVSTHQKDFSSFGGSTEKLVFFTIIEHSIARIVNPTLKPNLITRSMITTAFNKINKSPSGFIHNMFI